MHNNQGKKKRIFRISDNNALKEFLKYVEELAKIIKEIKNNKS